MIGLIDWPGSVPPRAQAGFGLDSGCNDLEDHFIRKMSYVVVFVWWQALAFEGGDRMGQDASVPNGEIELVVEFHPIDSQAVEPIRNAFPHGELFESNAFTGDSTVILIVAASIKAIGDVLQFFALHRQSYKDASIKIGRDEVSLTGYSTAEIESLLESPAVAKLVKHFDKK